MTDRGEARRRPPRAPMTARARRRRALAAGAAACWVLLVALTSSVVTGTVLGLLLAALGAAAVVGLRAMGIGAEHPWVRGMRSRPWRDGQDVLRLALRHLPEVFVITPGGALLAPNSVELRLNPRDAGSLREAVDPGLAEETATEVYRENVAARGARFARPGTGRVRIVADPSVPAGRYRLRHARTAGGAPACPEEERGPVPAGGCGPAGAPLPGGWPYARDGSTRGGPVTGAGGQPTLAEREAFPVLRLVTGGRVAQTQVSPSRAGRGDVELVLPGVGTVSREHARFTYEYGRWWVTNLGRNGLTLNGSPLTERCAVSDGDRIQWGKSAEAPLSRVEVG